MSVPCFGCGNLMQYGNRSLAKMLLDVQMLWPWARSLRHWHGECYRAAHK